MKKRLMVFDMSGEGKRKSGRKKKQRKEENESVTTKFMTYERKKAREGL